ncbi:MAG: ATP-grasp domain-containing protein [Myxococcales bacterium]|nr:ATP-grasp domain-containing protein [Myxococcales bacterium]
MFGKLLIANRGEVAVRIARTCERMGIATVAVHSEVEGEALHVQACDEAVAIGPAAVRESYLNAEAIIEAARARGAEAIHPGYGMLSENHSFARAVADAGLVFVGPPPEALERFGDKLRARQVASQAGVRAIPGTETAVDSLEQARDQAEDIGYPLLVKASAGGGGIGMQRVDDEDDLEAALERARERAESAFGDGRVYLEHCIDQPRHVEVQVLADANGECVALGERECSVQRRHQKILEESPAPALEALHNGELKRRILWDSAIRIAKEGGYVNAGTAEFLMDVRGRFYFMEFNPRLQVEHAVTELCTGLDIVELQLQIAAGEALPNEARTVAPAGHAIEARVYAEDPHKGFIPKPGKIETMRWPTVAPGALRVETGAAAGSEVTSHYDPLVAKFITYHPTRHQALLTLDRVLAETTIAPLTTNLTFLRQILADESFRAGQYDTDFTARLLAQLKG